MPKSPEKNQIECGILAESDADAMAKLLGEVFSRHDPPVEDSSPHGGSETRHGGPGAD